MEQKEAAILYKDFGRALALTKISQLQLPSLVDEQVLGLQVPVQDLAAVAVGEAPEQLEHENLQGEKGRGSPRWEHTPRLGRKRACTPALGLGQGGGHNRVEGSYWRLPGSPAHVDAPSWAPPRGEGTGHAEEAAGWAGESAPVGS